MALPVLGRFQSTNISYPGSQSVKCQLTIVKNVLITLWFCLYRDCKKCLQLCDSASSKTLQNVLFCLFLSTCVMQSVCVYNMDFVSAHKQINSKPYPLQNLMKLGIHVGFEPQTTKLKFLIDQIIGFQNMGGYFFIFKKIRGAPNFKSPYLLN